MTPPASSGTPGAGPPPDRLLSATKSALGTTGSRILTFGLMFASSLIVSRTLGPEGRGGYYVPVAAIMLCAGLFHASLAQAAIRHYGQGAANLHDLLRSLSALGWILGLLGGGGLLCASRIAPSVFAGVHPNATVLAALAVPFTIQVLYMECLFSLSHRIGSANRALILSAALHLAGALLLKSIGRLDPTSVVALYLANTLLTWALFRILLHRQTGEGGSLSLPLCRQLLATGLRTHAGIALWFLHLRLGLFLLRSGTDLTQTGLYSLAMNLAELLWLATDAVALSVLPYQAEGNAPESARVTAKAIRSTILAALPVAGGLAAAAIPFLTCAYGPSFHAAAVPLWILLPGMIAMTAQRLAWVYLLRFGNPLRLSLLMAFQVSVNAALTWTLVPRLGIAGAATAATTSYILGTAILMLEYGRVSGSSWSGIFRFEPGETKALFSAVLSTLRRTASIEGSTRPRGP